ncbi:hypothetical protein [Calothrix sp. 336/3]|nr:hypothetical protein [Calothrix sp. 336/3]
MGGQILQDRENVQKIGKTYKTQKSAIAILIDNSYQLEKNQVPGKQ